ncbi:dienelactone hydrolase [Desulfuromonas versatilis]|uniref:Dienelactone hydrolase n=1 Tax=Desulfuromonas versatilis TaxID=2802975 RepID=A0ABM8HR18_9BACT|nr:dienelactone hydrolase family protein [Desulfuromonas versatilis]BCR04346.1 dienelactone hydrolase [Desulfuromonas versatilis]
MKSLITLICLSILSATAHAAGSTVTYQVDGAPFEGYYLSPAESAPLVVIVHDWDGLNDYEVKRAEMLAGMGYAVFAVDLFGKGVRPTTTEEKKQLTGALYKDRQRMRALLKGGLDAAKAQGGNIENAVAIGYCFGGAAVLELARTGTDLKGFVSFHGGLATPEGQDYSKARGKLLVLHGTADASVSMEDFAALAVQLESQGINHEMITYSGAPHAFTVFGSDRYRQDADEKSWKRFGEFLVETLK